MPKSRATSNVTLQVKNDAFSFVIEITPPLRKDLMKIISTRKLCHTEEGVSSRATQLIVNI